ncbi:unnamed protein product [Boreogadus saida]
MGDFPPPGFLLVNAAYGLSHRTSDETISWLGHCESGALLVGSDGFSETGGGAKKAKQWRAFESKQRNKQRGEGEPKRGKEEVTCLSFTFLGVGHMLCVHQTKTENFFTLVLCLTNLWPFLFS